MGKASRAKRPGGAPAAAAPGVGATRGTAPATRSTRRERRAGAVSAPVAPPTGLVAVFARWDLWLAAIAAAFWLLGHIPALAPVAIPAWILAGLALGLLQPWLGLLLTIAVVPFLGGATDAQSGEVLRVIPIYGATARVLLDRFVLGPSLGQASRPGPPWWVVAAAVAAAGLYAYTAETGSIAVGNDPLFLDSGLHWLAGGPIAMMAAWIAASHLVAGRQDRFGDVVLVVLVAACTLALASALGLPGVEMFTFPGMVGNRLGALGYPTPTAMGIATSLPFAVWAAWWRKRWLALAVIGLALVTVTLTLSRGPLIAIFVGAAAAVLAGGRVQRRILAAGGAAILVAGAFLFVLRYGTDPAAIMANLNGIMGSDVDRIATWGAAVSITLANPLVGGGWRSLERFGDFAQRSIAYSHDIILHGFSEGGLPLGIANATVILYSAWIVWRGRHAMAPYLIGSVVIFLVCGFWDIPQVRSYAAVMGGIVLGMAAGPLIGRGDRSVEGAIGVRPTT